MQTLYILRYLSYKSSNSNLHGVFTSKEAAVNAASSNYEQEPELISMLYKENKFYDCDGYVVIDEIKINTFYDTLNRFLL